MDSKKLANEIAVAIMSEGHIDKNGMCQRRDLERAAMEMATAKEQQFNNILDEIYSHVAGSCASQDSIIRNTILEIKEKLK